jgi:hypothetical protein
MWMILFLYIFFPSKKYFNYQGRKYVFKSINMNITTLFTLVNFDKSKIKTIIPYRVGFACD